MLEIIEREIVYISYYFMVQFRQIFVYWVLGMVIGSLIFCLCERCHPQSVRRS